MDYYTRYINLMRQVYGPTCPLPSPSQWNSMCIAPKHQTSTADFDIETERREGWGYQEGSNQ